MLTVRSQVYACTRGQARFVAECANLEHKISSFKPDYQALAKQWEAMHPAPVAPKSTKEMSDEEYEAFEKIELPWLRARRIWEDEQIKAVEDKVNRHDKYDFWEDRQTGGGGARICWREGIAWVSAHSGYAWADVTETVKEFFAELGCKPLEYLTAPDNPFIYGNERYEESKQYRMREYGPPMTPAEYRAKYYEGD